MNNTINEIVKEHVKKTGRTSAWLAEQMGDTRQGFYQKMARKTIDVAYLMRLCVVLDHDFFLDLSDEFIRERRRKNLLSTIQ